MNMNPVPDFQWAWAMTSLWTPTFIAPGPVTADVENIPFSAAAQAKESKDKLTSSTRTSKAHETT